MSTKKLPLEKLRIDGGTQPRASTNWEVVNAYCDDMKDGQQFPPIVVFFDGTDYWVADGFHRYNAAEQADYTHIDCDIRQGTQRDAILYSVGANATHGQRRTNEDKRRAVMRLLDDDEWREWNDSKIGRAAVVDHKTVAKYRAEWEAEHLGISQDKTRKVERNGTTYTQNTSNIGKSNPVRLVNNDADPEPADETETIVIDRETGEELPNAAIVKTTVKSPAKLPRFEQRRCVFTTVDIRPDDPEQGAQALVAAFERDYLLKLIEAIKSRLSQ